MNNSKGEQEAQDGGEKLPIVCLAPRSLLVPAIFFGIIGFFSIDFLFSPVVPPQRDFAGLLVGIVMFGGGAAFIWGLAVWAIVYVLCFQVIADDDGLCWRNFRVWRSARWDEVIDFSLTRRNGREAIILGPFEAKWSELRQIIANSETVPGESALWTFKTDDSEISFPPRAFIRFWGLSLEACLAEQLRLHPHIAFIDVLAREASASTDKSGTHSYRNSDARALIAGPTAIWAILPSSLLSSHFQPDLIPPQDGVQLLWGAVGAGFLPLLYVWLCFFRSKLIIVKEGLRHVSPFADFVLPWEEICDWQSNDHFITVVGANRSLRFGTFLNDWRGLRAEVARRAPNLKTLEDVADIYGASNSSAFEGDAS